MGAEVRRHIADLQTPRLEGLQGDGRERLDLRPEVAAVRAMLGGDFSGGKAVGPAQRKQQVAPGAGTIGGQRKRPPQGRNRGFAIAELRQQRAQIVVPLRNARVELDRPAISCERLIVPLLPSIEIAETDVDLGRDWRQIAGMAKMPLGVCQRQRIVQCLAEIELDFEGVGT